MATALCGPWQQQEVDSFLSSASLPIRLSTVAPDGFPRVISLWFLYQSPKFYCVTHRSSKLVQLLRKEPRVGFEVAPDAPPRNAPRVRASVLNNPPRDVVRVCEVLGITLPTRPALN